jgi:peptidoglycan/LPS O-acetylase OafA/YrhL
MAEMETPTAAMAGSLDIQSSDSAARSSRSGPETRGSHRSYFPALDGVRAFAFLVVFATHYLSMPWGWTGVDIFFVLSGFLITGILYDTRDKVNRVHNFYVRRTLRIFPLYYGLMILLVLVYPIFHWEWSWGWLIWPAYLGNFAWFFHGFAHPVSFQMLADAQPLSRTFPRIQLFFGHFWSLCVEEQFYLIWPWIVFWIKDRRKLIYVCLACIAVCPVLRIAASYMLPDFLLQKNVLILATPLRIDSLLLGGLIALLLRGPGAGKVLPAARIVFGCLSVIILVWWIVSPAAHHSWEGYAYPRWGFTWGMSVIDMYAASVIVMALDAGSLVFRVFNLRPLRWLGRISYGAYVFHDILHPEFVRVATHFFAQERLATAGIALVSTMILAAASFRWFEQPFIRLKERWTR